MYEDGKLVLEATTQADGSMRAVSLKNPDKKVKINTPLNWLFEKGLPPPQEWLSPQPSTGPTNWSFRKQYDSVSDGPGSGSSDYSRTHRRPPWYIEFSIGFR